VTGDRSADRPPEPVDFEAARVIVGRRRPSLFMAGWVVLLGGVVALGIIGRWGEASGAAGAAQAASLADAAGDARASSGHTDGGPRPPGLELSHRFDPAFPSLVVVEAGETGSLAVEATRRPSTVTIHGAVLAAGATAVRFSMQGLDGEVARSVALGVPELLADGRNHRPSWRMDLEMAIPTALAATALVIEADLYGPGGGRIDRIRLRLAPEM